MLTGGVMKVHVTGRNIRLTKAIQAYLDKKIAKTKKYSSKITWAEVILGVQKRTHHCEIVLHAAKQTFRSMSKAADLYAAIDLASDKIDSQLRKYKDRMKGRKKSAAPTPEIAVVDEPRSVRFSVVKKVAVEPMTADDAASEMDRLGYNFWMFRDEETGEINVIFRRIDESFGLLLPAKRNGR
jgi:putative sigma-54 modulation protein